MNVMVIAGCAITTVAMSKKIDQRLKIQKPSRKPGRGSTPQQVTTGMAMVQISRMIRSSIAHTYTLFSKNHCDYLVQHLRIHRGIYHIRYYNTWQLHSRETGSGDVGFGS